MHHSGIIQAREYRSHDCRARVAVRRMVVIRGRTLLQGTSGCMDIDHDDVLNSLGGRWMRRRRMGGVVMGCWVGCVMIYDHISWYTYMTICHDMRSCLLAIDQVSCGT